MCRFFDRRLVRRQFTDPRLPTQTVTPKVLRLSSQIDDAEIFESLAMKIRSGHHAWVALDELAKDEALPDLLIHLLSENHSASLQSVLQNFYAQTAQTKTSQFARLLLQSYRHGTLEPSALDHAARAVRQQIQRTSQLRIATAQARLTIRVLTLLPVISVVMGIVLSSSFRSSLQNYGVIAIVVFGLVLNVVGYIWMHVINKSIETNSQPSLLHQLVTSATISLQSGESLISAIEKWGEVNFVGELVRQRFIRGESLSSALLALEMQCGEKGRTVRQLLLDNHQSGTPASDLIARLQEDANSDLSNRINVGIQQISTKLTFPVVLCVLPAFLLLTFIPVVVASFSSLSSTSLT